MKTRLMLLIACTVGIGFAAEPVSLPLELGTVTIATKTYEDAKIVSADAVGVKIMHASGTGRIPYEKLPYELASKFPRDEEAAKEQADREAAAVAAYEQQVELVALKKQEREEEELERNGGRPRMSKMDAVIAGQRAMQLQEYVTYLKMGIANAQGEVEKRMIRAQRAESRRSYYYYGYYSNRGASRGDTIRLMAVKYKVQIAQAKILIDRAEDELARLEGAR